MRALFNYILKVIKFLYGILKGSNHWFAIYYSHYNDKLGMIESTHDSCLLYKSEHLSIIGLQTNNILMLVEDLFIIIKKVTIKTVNIITKKHIYFTFKMFIKFHNIFIQLALSVDIILSQETCVGGILLMKNYEASIISLKEIIQVKLSQKK